VTSLSELRSQGQQFYSVEWSYPNSYYEGDRGNNIRLLQYMLSVLSAYIPEIPRVEVDGIFGPATREAVLAAQRWFGLPQTGSVDAATWDEIYDQFSGIETTSLRDGERFPQIQQQAVAAFAANQSNNRTRYNRTATLTQFPGMDLRVGMQDPISQEVVR
jgi:peptidoglycan hydrolase-like protein with peptidoglycan-binding domain